MVKAMINFLLMYFFQWLEILNYSLTPFFLPVLYQFKYCQVLLETGELGIPCMLKCAVRV